MYIAHNKEIEKEISQKTNLFLYEAVSEYLMNLGPRPKFKSNTPIPLVVRKHFPDVPKSTESPQKYLLFSD